MKPALRVPAPGAVCLITVATLPRLRYLQRGEATLPVGRPGCRTPAHVARCVSRRCAAAGTWLRCSGHVLAAILPGDYFACQGADAVLVPLALWWNIGAPIWEPGSGAASLLLLCVAAWSHAAFYRATTARSNVLATVFPRGCCTAASTVGCLFLPETVPTAPGTGKASATILAHP